MMGKRHVGGIPRIATLSVGQQAAVGDDPSVKAWRREGYTPYCGDAGAGLHLVVGFYNTQRDIPTAAGLIRMYGTADDVNPTGDGYRTVRVHGLDANYALQTEDVALNGSTLVYTTKTFIRVFDIEVLTAGSDITGSSCACKSADGVDFYMYLGAGDNMYKTLDAAWCVPAGQKLYVVRWGAHTRDDTVVSLRLDHRAFGRGFFTAESRIQLYRNSVSHELNSPIIVEEKGDIQIVALSDASNHEVGAYMEGWYQSA